MTGDLIAAPTRDLGPMTCSACGAECIRRSVMQRYCRTCSTANARRRTREWAARHQKPRTDAARQTAKNRAAKRRAHGAAFRGEGSISWEPGSMGAALLWSVRVWVPFSYGLSKNAVWSTAKGGGHVFMRDRTRALRQQIALVLRAALSRAATAAVEAKVYVDIFVQKPDHRGDAINVIDVVCDGIKDALGVDDRWFSIRGVDWEVVKHGDPRIWIGVGQATAEPQRICCLCGRALPLSDFTKSKHNALGVGRECRFCRGVVGT